MKICAVEAMDDTYEKVYNTWIEGENKCQKSVTNVGEIWNLDTWII